jgi:uncharacterized tellurite resistance protein B-like protein
MIDRLKAFFARTDPVVEAQPDADPVLGACAVMLVKAALLDGEADSVELTRVAELLDKRFELGAEATESLIAEARELAEEAVDHYSFTRTVRESFEHDERVHLVEMMWEVVYADGVVHDHEAALMRRVSGLLFVSDRESGDARKRAQDNLATG